MQGDAAACSQLCSMCTAPGRVRDCEPFGGPCVVPRQDSALTPREPHTKNMAESKRQRSNVVVEELQEDDLQAAGAIFHDAFDGDEINAILYPEHRIARAGYTRKDRVAHSARSVRKNHWNKQGKIVLKAVDPDSREILGIAVWVEPGYVQKYQREQREKAAAAAGQENGKDAVREEEEEEGKNLELDEAVLGRMMNEMTSVRERVMGDEPFWYACRLPPVSFPLPSPNAHN